MIEENERPLLSFCLVAYKQEAYIREAIAGAFSQTYSPLEIILSDDCSPDRTFEIMKEYAASYTGPHKIVLNRNVKNIGLGAHVNRVFDLAQGELMVGAAGDDISLPERVDVLFREWVRHHEPSGMASTFIDIDQKGGRCSSQSALGYSSGSINASGKDELLTIRVNNPRFSLPGCAAAWTKKMWKAFGPLPNGVVNEDAVLTLRCILLNGLCMVEAPLVMYRHHDQNIWASLDVTNNAISRTWANAYEEYQQREANNSRKAVAILRLHEAALKDLEAAFNQGWLAKDLYARVSAVTETARSLAFVRSNWWGFPIWKKLINLKKTNGKIANRLLKMLPLNVYVRAVACAGWVKRRVIGGGAGVYG